MISSTCNISWMNNEYVHPGDADDDDEYVHPDADDDDLLIIN